MLKPLAGDAGPRLSTIRLRPRRRGLGDHFVRSRLTRLVSRGFTLVELAMRLGRRVSRGLISASKPNLIVAVMETVSRRFMQVRRNEPAGEVTALQISMAKNVSGIMATKLRMLCVQLLRLYASMAATSRPSATKLTVVAIRTRGSMGLPFG